MGVVSTATCTRCGHIHWASASCLVEHKSNEHCVGCDELSKRVKALEKQLDNMTKELKRRLGGF